MKNKGFTLVELLATILVIAVISLIAVPVVTSVIEKSQKGTFLRSAEGVRKISSNYYIQNSAIFSSIDELKFICNNEKCYNSDNLDIIANKNLGVEEEMGNGYVKIYDDGNVEFLLSNGKYCAEKNPKKEEVRLYNNGTCEGIIIETEKIKLNEPNIISTTKSIRVYGNVTVGKSGVGKYEFYIDGKLDGVIETTDINYDYTFKDVKGKNHMVMVKVYNGTLNKPNYDESIGFDEKEIPVSLLDFGNITISPSEASWSSSKTYTLSGTTEGASLQYKVVSGVIVKQDWTNYSGDVTVNWQSTTNVPTYIYARFNDGVNTSDEITYTETKIDTTAPSAPTVMRGVYEDWTVIDLTNWHNKNVYFSQTGKNGEILVSGAEDNESGIARYEISSDNKTWYDLSKCDMTGVYKTSASTKRYYRAINMVGLASSSTEVDIKIDTINPTVSYSLAGGIYNAYKTIRVTPNDANYSNMAVHVYKNNAKVYSGKVDAKSTDSTSASYYDVALDSDGAWTIYTAVYDKAGNRQNQNPDNGGGWYYQTYTIDTTAPYNVSLTKGTVNTKEITVVANAKDNESGIKGYQFSIDNGSSWKPIQSSNTYTFKGLTTGTYNIKVKAYNNANLTSVSNTLSVSTAIIDKPTFKISPDGWVLNKTVTITYPSVASIKEYSIDGGKTWKTYTGAINFTATGNVVAKASDGVNSVTSSTTVLIDTTTPVASITVFNGSGKQISNGGTIGSTGTSTIKFNCSAGVSGVSEYQYSSMHKVTYNPSIESKTITTTNALYNYKIIPNNLKNSLGNAVTSGTIHHVLICKSGAGYTSNVAEFDTVVVDDTIKLSLSQTGRTISSITVKATATSGIGIAKYEFKIDSGAWINNGTTNAYTFKDLVEDTTHTIYTRVTNNSGIVLEENISASTSSSVTCATEGSCSCGSDRKLSGTIYQVCKDSDGTVVSSKAVHTCSGSCSGGSGGGSGSTCTCGCSAMKAELECTVAKEEGCSVQNAYAILQCCTSQGISCEGY